MQDKKPLILNVDDYDAGRYATTRVLKTAGFAVIEATTGAEALKKVKEEAEETPAGEEAPKDKAKLVGKYLDKTTTLMEKLKKMGEATAALAEKVAPAVVKALPLLASARHLFGLP